MRAAEYWNQAAQASARLYAHDETERLARRGLALLEAQPESSEKAAAELGLQMTYGLSMKTSRGYAVPEVGRAYARARDLCRQIDDPVKVVPVLIGLSAHHVVSGEINDELAALCRAHGIAQELQWGAPLRGRALVELGTIDEGLDELKAGLAAHTLTRSALLRPYFFVLYAGALLRARRFDEAQTALTESHAVADQTSQHAYDSEHRRLQAEVLLAQGDVEGTERVYRESLEIARLQGARWFELRASRGYASFLIGAGRADEARTVLGICDAITEGRDTHDFVYAEALLRTL